MYKRKDNDIFGTANSGYAPRIENASSIDPNAAFKKKMEENYDRYASKVTNHPHTITSKPLDSTKVNEKVNFEDSYHKFRKQADMQSSIFYEPTAKVPLQEKQPVKNSVVNSRVNEQVNFGKKQTFKREINKLPINDAHHGNTSRLFDLDQRMRPKTEETIPMAPLIPCQMQWDQHDSVRYAHINDPNKSPEEKPSKEFQEIDVSKSTYFNQEQIEVQKDVVEKKEEPNMLKKAKSQKQLKKVETVKKGKEPVEIRILKGWDYKFMEGLSKHCKLSGSAIVKFEAEEAGKATLVVARSQRWENVTDWLRKDAKLRIRVMNN